MKKALVLYFSVYETARKTAEEIAFGKCRQKFLAKEQIHLYNSLRALTGNVPEARYEYLLEWRSW